ncbi:MAG: hypothetical protein QE263_09535 [Vampirovibrionales bacterium]|nr:hypothetical protein [Vampirovibrionales bacterium]
MVTNLNPISNIYATGTAAAAKIKDKKQAFEAHGAAVHGENTRLMEQFIFGSAKKIEWHFEQQENHADSALGKYYQKINKVDLDGDGNIDAYVKCFWDEKGHMYEVQVGKDLRHLERVDSDAKLEDIDSRFVTSLDNKTAAPAPAAPTKAPEPAKKEANQPINYKHPQTIENINTLDFCAEGYDNLVSNTVELSALFPKEKQARLTELQEKDEKAGKIYDEKHSQIYKNAERDVDNSAIRKRQKADDVALSQYKKIAKPLNAEYNRIMRAEVKKLIKDGKLRLEDINLIFDYRK